MNTSSMGRLFWKEYRMQRAFWLGVAGLAAWTQVLAWFVTQLLTTTSALPALYGIASGAAVLYVLGCAATTFAAEHETETFAFQQQLPVSGLGVFFSKVTFVVVSTIALAAVLWLSTFLVVGGEVPRHQLDMLWSTSVAALELLAWGVFFSLLTRRPLQAVLLAAVAALTVALVVVPWMLQLSGQPLYAGNYNATLPLRTGIALLLLVADAGLARGWLRDRVAGRWQWRDGSEARPARKQSLRRSPGSMASLLWQQWRESAWIVFAVGLIPAVATFWAIRDSLQQPGLRYLLLLPLISGVLGCCVFQADQRHHSYRFLAERGVAPGRLWLSRQLFWGCVVLAWCIVIAGAVFSWFMFDNLRDSATGAWVSAGTVEHLRYLGRHVAGAFGCAALAYAAGQAASLLLRSGILAITVGLMAGLLLIGWTVLMHHLAIPLLWSVLPLPVGLFLVSRVRTLPWMLDRGGWRGWRGTAATLGIPVLALAIAVPTYRVQQIPLVDPGFDPVAFYELPSAEARATAELYKQIIFQLRGSAEPAQHLRHNRFGMELTANQLTVVVENAALVPELIEVTKREEFAAGKYGLQREVYPFEKLGWLLIASGQHEQVQGELDGASERYLAALRLANHLRQRTATPRIGDELAGVVRIRLMVWASHPRQTAGRLLDALEQLQAVYEQVPSDSRALKYEYLAAMALLDADPDLADSRKTARNIAFLSAAMPWEIARARRLAAYRARHELQRLEDARQKLAAGESLQEVNDAQYRPESMVQDDEWSRTTLLPQGGWDGTRFVHQETSWRLLRLVLALNAHRLQHGQLPRQLQQLVQPEGPLDEVPLDPYTGTPFFYSPDGTAGLEKLPLSAEARRRLPNTGFVHSPLFMWVPIVAPQHEGTSNIERATSNFEWMPNGR